MSLGHEVRKPKLCKFKENSVSLILRRSSHHRSLSCLVGLLLVSS